MEWQAYLTWRAQLSARIDINVRARLQAQARFELGRTPDPYASRPLYIPGPTYPRITFPRLGLGLLAPCVGHYVGDTAAVYAGYCPSIRYRLGTLGIALDPAIVTVREAGVPYGMVGLRPGITYALVEGHHETWGSEFYASAGLYGYLTLGSREPSAGSFWGGYAGLGVQATGDLWTFGVEWRALTRSAFEPSYLGGAGAGPSVASFRLGSETRVYIGIEF